MNLFELEHLPDVAAAPPVLLAGLDGWTDAGSAGSTAAQVLRDTYAPQPLGAFPADRLYDYRDRRPLLEIEEGQLGSPQWPELVVELITPPAGPPLVLVTGGEPDFAWQSASADLVELARRLGATRYVGLGAVPGPVPHTRPTHLISTSSSPELSVQMGRPHEQVVVPASFQVVLETAVADAGLQTLGLWARVPHYVAGEYPAGARALLERLASHLGTPVDLAVLDADITDNRERLDLAADGSDEVTDHIRQLEELHDTEISRADGTEQQGPMTFGPLPSGEEIAAEVERFLRGRRE